ncbi:unnamed protein product [Urochloa decumbens]|uniref:F-box domain-containing protein n=1 Tax=Urochloa decumbens TaxID=240449 RepID=A0ABC8YTW8_9POAL
MEELLFRRPLSFLPVRAVTPHGTLSAVPGGDDDGGEDRISALPDELLHIVVSRLPIKDAVRTTVLSPRWRGIWRSAPLVLYDAHLLPAREPARAAAVDRVLAAHPGPIRAVHLAYCFLAAHERELARWPRRLAAGRVRDLVFLNLTAAMNLVPLPADILRCAELRRLYLGFWMFPDTGSFPEGAGGFPHLRELVLINTFMEDSSLDRVLATSPALKTLALVVSYGKGKHVRLRGPKLQCVLFWQSEAVELAVLDAPRLERLIMWETSAPSEGDGSLMAVKIAEGASSLKVLGYLQLGVHKLEIGNTVIKADTNVSPTSMVPSVKNLALMVNLGVLEEVQMLASFLRRFPNIETLHLEHVFYGGPTGNDYADFFMELSPIECVQSHIRTVILHGMSGDLSEVAFLMYLSQRANELQKLTLVVTDKKTATVDDVKHILQVLAITPWASERCMVSLVHPKLEHDLNFHRASNLSVSDPFLEHGRECFRFTKEGYPRV